MTKEQPASDARSQRGRPRVERGRAVNKVMQLRLRDEETAWLDEQARLVGIPKATLVRMWIVARMRADQQERGEKQS